MEMPWISKEKNSLPKSTIDASGRTNGEKTDPLLSQSILMCMQVASENRNTNPNDSKSNHIPRRPFLAPNLESSCSSDTEKGAVPVYSFFSTGQLIAQSRQAIPRKRKRSTHSSISPDYAQFPNNFPNPTRTRDYFFYRTRRMTAEGYTSADTDQDSDRGCKVLVKPDLGPVLAFAPINTRREESAVYRYMPTKGCMRSVLYR